MIIKLCVFRGFWWAEAGFYTQLLRVRKPRITVDRVNHHNCERRTWELTWLGFRLYRQNFRIKDEGTNEIYNPAMSVRAP